MTSRRGRCRGAATLAATCAVAWPAGAAAEPITFAHGSVDHRLTTIERKAPTGFSYTGTYHAAGDPGAHPPYMRRMVFYNRSGLRYDTSVPDRCTAGDLELAARGAAACPPGSRLGSGKSDVAFMGTFPSTVEIDVFNNTNEQIMVARSPGLATVARGRIHRDGSVEFASPTCYPSVQPGGCPVDNVLQLASQVSVPAYTRTARDGKVRSWLTTPSKCPRSGRWRDPIRFWWADGSVDTVVTEKPCRKRRARRR